MTKLIRIIAILLILVVLTISPVSAMTRECGISERVVLENTTDAPVTYTFTRGSHNGLVMVLPGQVVTVDVIWCK